MEDLQKLQQIELDALKQIQRDYHKALTNRQLLDAQLNETTTVKDELHLLKSGNDVFKLIGPVFVKQDLEEAKQNVNKRIEFITNELKRTEKLMSDLDNKQETHHSNFVSLQQKLKLAQQSATVKN